MCTHVIVGVILHHVDLRFRKIRILACKLEDGNDENLNTILFLNIICILTFFHYSHHTIFR